MKALLINRLLLVLAFVGLFISGFLSLAKILSANVPCGKSGGCDAVTNHSTGFWLGIPVSYWGFLGYGLLALMAIVRTVRGLDRTRGLVMPGYFVAAAGTVGSLYLQYVSLFQIGAVCPWCLASALTMVATLILYAILAQSMDEAPAGSLPADDKGFTLATGLAAATILSLGVGGAFLKGNAAKMGAVEVDPKKAQMETLIPKDANTFGDPNAPITVVEFADMYCPACRKSSPELKDVVAKSNGKIRMVYRHFPLMQKHPLALNAALIAEAAADEGKFYDYLIAVMKTDGSEEIGPDALYALAGQVGLDPEKIKKRIRDEKDPIYKRVQRDIELSDRLGLQVTPTFIIMLDGKVRHIASSNDVFQTLQKSPYIEVLGK